MKAFKVVFIMIGTMISCSMHGSQISKKHKTTQQEWKKFQDFHSKAPKLVPVMSQELPKPLSYGVFVQSTYGDENKPRNPYQATMHFEQATKMVQQSRDLGSSLDLGTMYRFSHGQKEITQQVFDGLAESHNKRILSVSAETLQEMGTNLPSAVKHSFSDEVTIQLENSVEGKIECLAVHTLEGAMIGAGTAAIVSLAKNSSHNAIKETEKVLWAHKEQIAKEVIQRSAKVIADHGIKAIDRGLDYAATQLNEINFDKVGGHCDYESYHESQEFFRNTAKEAGSVLKDEFIHEGIQFGIKLAAEHAPGAIFKPSNLAIDFDDVKLGGEIGAGLGFAYAACWEMHKPIQKIPLRQI
jgi:hypothetical protein